MTSPATTTATAIAKQRIQDRMRARARDFDIPALLALLDHLGYRRSDIVYRGHLALGPQPALVHAIAFPDHDDGDEAPRVIVTLNIGLLSCRSPLPSYFHKLLSNLDTGDPLLALLRLLDARLLATRCAAYWPERMLPKWPGLQRDVLRTAGLRSPSTLQSLFHHVFPELDVSAHRVRGERVLRTENARLGHAVLGGCAFGSQATAAVSAIEVILRCDEPRSRTGVPWAREARARLHRLVFDLLRDTDLHLTVYLVMLDRSTYAQFDNESYVGYDPLRGGPDLPHRVLLFRGPIPSGSPAGEPAGEPAGKPAGSLAGSPDHSPG